MKVLIVFGVIKSGKSTFCQYLEDKYNWYWYNSDFYAKKILQNNKFLHKKLIDIDPLLCDSKNKLIKLNQKVILETIFKNKNGTRDAINKLIWTEVHADALKKLFMPQTKQFNQKIVIETIDPFGLYHALNKSSLNNLNIKFCYIVRSQRQIEKSFRSIYHNQIIISELEFEKFLKYQIATFNKLKAVSRVSPQIIKNNFWWKRNIKKLIFNF